MTDNSDSRLPSRQDDEVWISAGSRNPHAYHTRRCKVVKDERWEYRAERRENLESTDVCDFCSRKALNAKDEANQNDSQADNTGIIPVEEVPSRYPDEYWRSAKSSAHKNKKYHTERSCHQLRTTNEIATIDRDSMRDIWEECSICSDECSAYNRGESVSNLAYRLRNADSFDEVAVNE